MDYICLLRLDIGFMRLDKLVTKTAIVIICFALTQLSACLSTLETKKGSSYLVATGEITENVDRFIDKSILVRNDMTQRVGTRGLILDNDRLFDGEAILVIDISKTTWEIIGDKTPEILVDGKVERLNMERVKQKYKIELEPDAYARYEGKPVIIANSIIPSPDPEDLTANPEIYYGKSLAIKGEVDDVKDYGIFEIDEEKVFGGEDLLVLQPESEIQLIEEQTAIVYGVLRQFIIEDLERDYNLGWNSLTKAQIEAKYANKPVLVTNKIQLLP